MILAILDRRGVVHDLHAGCLTVLQASPERPRKRVTPTQALVHKLPHCSMCFTAETYARIIQKGVS